MAPDWWRAGLTRWLDHQYNGRNTEQDIAERFETYAAMCRLVEDHPGLLDRDLPSVLRLVGR